MATAGNVYVVETQLPGMTSFKKFVFGKDVVELRAQVQTLKEKNEALQEKALETVKDMRALASSLQTQVDEIANRR
jgi:hypothetical protein